MHPHDTTTGRDTMAPDWKSWTLTIGAVAVAVTVATGYGQVISDALAVVGDVVLWLIRPLGPQS